MKKALCQQNARPVPLLIRYTAVIVLYVICCSVVLFYGEPLIINASNNTPPCGEPLFVIFVYIQLTITAAATSSHTSSTTVAAVTITSLSFAAAAATTLSSSVYN
ncbi:hypothetical protein CVS40_11760 [Lucilia cuprina]|nr:hypothetical protein CVS40_11760 [Lucilia cuprina]